MSPDNIAIVRASWPTIAIRGDVLTTRFYEVLFEIDESAVRLFAGVDMVAQREKLLKSLGVIVEALDELDRLLPTLAELGRRHVGYGVQRRHFESVGAALNRAIADVFGDDFTTELRDAWAEAYALVAAVMRRAVDRATTV
jgi:hemoglobin-like flavoprotein